MVRGDRELVIGGHLDPVFGPVVVVGDGGIAVEAMPDNALLLPPFDYEELQRAIAGLRIGRLFEGVRSRQPLDFRAVADAAQAVARLLADDEAGVVSVDINPLIVSGSGGCAVDALVETISAGKNSA